MSRARVLVGFAMLGLAAFAVTAYARQADTEGEGAWFPSLPEIDLGAWVDNALPIDEISQEIWNLGSEVSTMQNQNIDIGANVSAFLATIRQCEGTAGQPDPYRVCYGYAHTISDLRDHPAITGEWRGERLTDAQCRGVGLGSGCVSTAAGAYQMIKPTWAGLKSRLGLPDFGQASQEAAAVQLLRDCGAYDRLAVGDLAGAVTRARRIWASLPGANYAGQGMRSMAQVSAWYTGAGGVAA